MQPFVFGMLSLMFASTVSVSWADETAEPKAAAGAPPQRLVGAARQMIADFKVTRYSHKTFIDREQSVCEVDCSGFIVALLKQTSREHLRQIATTHKRPLAEDFYEAFAAAEGDGPPAWRPIRRLQNVEPGDVIAWRKVEREPGDNTGHVVLVEEKPSADAPHQFRVRIMDSTLHGHAHDSRPDGKSGIGRGTIWLDVDEGGHPIGFRWKAKNGRLHEVPIAIGRAVPIPD